MRRPLAVLWAAALVLLLGVVAAPPASAADLPYGPYLWATTADKTLVFSTDRLNQQPVAQYSNQPTGNLVRVNSQTGPWVVVPTRTGIDVFDAGTGGYADTFVGDPGGYRQVAAVEAASVGPPSIYALRTDGTAIDVFVGGLSPSVTIQLPGPATYMSTPRPVFKDKILLGSVKNNADGTYLSAVVNTADNTVDYFNAPTNQLVNGTAWSPDGSRAYLSSTNLDGTGGAVGTFTLPLGYTNTPAPAGQTPQQIVVNRDGSQLYVASVDTAGQGSYQVVDTRTMATVGSVDLGFFHTFGFTTVATDGSIYMPPGPQGQSGILRDDSTRGGTGSEIFVGGEQTPFLATLVVDLPAGSAALGGTGQKMYVNQTFTDPVEILVVDAYGNRLPDQQVTFSLDSGNGFFNGWGPLALITTGADGTATSPTILAGAAPGTLTVIASVEGLKDVHVPLTILPDPTPPSVTSLTNGDGQVTVAFTPGDGHGISPPTGFTVTAYDSATQQPAGVTAHGAASPIAVTGLTNGTSYTFTVTANTPLGNWTSAMSPAINAGVAATITGTPPPGEVGKPYRFTFTVAGAPAPTVGFDNDATPLPAGLTFDAATATISGTPTAAGSSYLSFTATNAVGTSEDDPTLVINPAGSLGGTEPTPTPSPSTSAGPSPTSSESASSSAARGYANASDSLASTGTSVGPVVGAAALLVLVGAALLLLVRRRSTGTR
jgi:hypothetical protein